MDHPRIELQQNAEHFTTSCPAANRIVKTADLDIAMIKSRRELIEATVAQVFGVHAHLLPAITRGTADVAQARQVAMYLTHTVFSLNLSDTGRIFDRDRTTVAHACTVVEDMRDALVFDRVMELLEGVMAALILPRGTASRPN